ncbi:MAG: LamG domain-containing protein [Phycisphaerales bacterium]|nr:MAG: LamG domain-containing protein [Phycisphaerales bacterium]
MCGRRLFSLTAYVFVLLAAGSASADLVAHYEFSEGSGTTVYDPVRDTTVNITYDIGPVTWLVPGGIAERDLGNALSFDKEDHQFIKSDAPSGLADSFTWTGWVRPVEPYSDSTIGIVQNGSFYLRDNKPRWYFKMDNGVVVADELTSALPANTWSHLALVFQNVAGDGSTWENAVINIYVDGVSVRTMGTMTPSNLAVPANYTLGKHPKASADWFTGSMDDARLYDKALKPSEIAEVYNIGALIDPLESVNPDPPHNASGVSIAADLSWTPGDAATHSDVYFGTDFDDVNEAADPYTAPGRGRQDTSSYEPGILEYGKTYYWRVDGVGLSDVRKGEVWKFTAGDSLIVDDFEGYADDANLAAAWPHNIAGYDYIYLETEETHRGAKAMRFEYQNQYEPFYTVATHTFDDVQDWTVAGLKVMDLWLHGDPCNVSEQLHVTIKDSDGRAARITHDDPNAVQNNKWQVWQIELRDFVDANGVNLAMVSGISVGLGDGLDSGQMLEDNDVVYIDDIRLYPSRCTSPPALDLNGDCIVDFKDFATIAAGWLENGLWP